MKKLGILIHQIINSQQYIVIAQNLNKICQQNPEIDVVLFHNDLKVTQQPNEFAIMQSVETLDYDGVLIATDIISAHILPSCLCAQKRYFYVWDMNWFLQNRPIQFVQDVYLNKDIKLIARSTEHYEAISRVFRRPEYLIEEFDHEQLINNIIYSEAIQQNAS